MLREFLPEAASGEFWGCDLHAPTIAWLSEHLSPPLHFYANDQIRMPHPDGFFDLIYAISVFTHITHDWSARLLELHRILKPDGYLLATIIGPPAWGRSLQIRPTRTGSECASSGSDSRSTIRAAPACCIRPGGFAPIGEGHLRSFP